jgi:hypothetical protein
MKSVFILVNHHRMTRICATLVTHHNINALGKHVGDLALALVTPLSAYKHNCWHYFSSILIFKMSSIKRDGIPFLQKTKKTQTVHLTV